MNQYDEFRDWSLRHYGGSLRDAVAAEHALALEALTPPRLVSSAYWHYHGPDVAPFALYTQWMLHRVTIASIAGDGDRQGRLGPICDAFEATGLSVRWGSVINQPLRYALHRRGYVSSVPEPTPSADMLLTQERALKG